MLTTLFIHLHKIDIFLCILIYVDDLWISGNNDASVTKFRSYLHSYFHMKDLGLLKYFLGIEIAHSKEGIYLSQQKYALEIISDTGLLGSKPISTPLEPNHNLAKATVDFFAHLNRYRCLIGKLIYLTITRPDFAYTVYTLAQLCTNLAWNTGSLPFEWSIFLRAFQPWRFFFKLMLSCS